MDHEDELQRVRQEYEQRLIDMGSKYEAELAAARKREKDHIDHMQRGEAEVRGGNCCCFVLQIAGSGKQDDLTLFSCFLALQKVDILDRLDKMQQLHSYTA